MYAGAPYSQGYAVHAHAWFCARSHCYLPVLKLSCNEYRFLLSLQSTIGTNSKHLCPAPAKTECDYAVHFVCRHLPDRCICWANLDGFTGWILNQKRILAPAGKGARRRIVSAMPRTRTSAGNHSSTRPHWEEGIASDCYPHRVRSGGDEWERNAHRVYEHLISAVQECLDPLCHRHSPPISTPKRNFKSCRSLTFLCWHVLSPAHCCGLLQYIFLSTSHLNHLSLITYCSLYHCSLSLLLSISLLFYHLCSLRCLVGRMTIIRGGKYF